MTKQEFLARLEQGLSGIPRADLDERLGFYGEMIDDRTEDGCSEDEAVAQIGPVEDIIARTLDEIPLAKLVRQRVTPRQAMRPWQIVLLVLGAPLWLPLVAAAGALVLTAYVVLWAVVICVWAVALSLAVTAGACVISAVQAAHGSAAEILGYLGLGLLLAGLCIGWVFVCLAATRGILALSRQMALGLKRLFIR